MDTYNASRAYHTGYRNATSGPRLEMADAVRDFTIQAAELSRVMALPVPSEYPKRARSTVAFTVCV